MQRVCVLLMPPLRPAQGELLSVLAVRLGSRLMKCSERGACIILVHFCNWVLYLNEHYQLLTLFKPKDKAGVGSIHQPWTVPPARKAPANERGWITIGGERGPELLINSCGWANAAAITASNTHNSIFAPNYVVCSPILEADYIKKVPH